MKRIKLLAAILCLSMQGFAQPGAGVVDKVLPIKVDLGIKAGANFANLNGKEWESGYKPGIVGGIFGGISRKKVGATAEVLVSSVRYTGSGVNFYNANKLIFNNMADSAKKGDFAVTYVHIPVLFNYKIGGPLWLQAGPMYSGVIGINDKDNLLKSTTGLLKSGDVSGVLGLQLNFSKLRANARYIIGLTDMSASSIGNSWRTRTVQLTLGYSFL
ncbi:hypothetical protein CAP35_14710 [Chitinophagaceae bacterium IBVUCB1]|nr:hypothetical protein CAP35_14710 [Chitinophagaceae bacterium IBVUCB1]